MTKSEWKLLHEEQPEDGSECYLGFKDRDGDFFVRRRIWRFRYGGWVDAKERGTFGECLAYCLPFDIYWCESSRFPDLFAAGKSLRLLLGAS